MIGALVIGTVLAVGAVGYVLYPMFFGMTTSPTSYASPEPRRSDRAAAVDALREIEFDRATGKLSDTDYAELKTRYTDQAILAMRRELPSPSSESPSSDKARGATHQNGEPDEIELVIRAYRDGQAACSVCGPRPEADAVFCSTCGRYLHDRCTDCGAPVEVP